MNGDRVCIIGASFGGIPAGKVFLDDGFDVTIFERSGEIGGIWSSQRRYVDLKNQHADGTFELIEKPLGSGYTPAAEMQQYLREYAEEFDIWRHIEFQTEVVHAAPVEDGWLVETRDTDRTDSTSEHQFDYVVVCSGSYDIPCVPEYPGMDAFDGTILHSSEFRDRDQARDRDVAVVGCGTSAIDVSTEAARVASSTSMVFRRAHWQFPKRFWGIAPLRLFYSRLSEAFLPRYYNDDTWRWLDRVPRPIKQGLGRLFEHGIKKGAGYDTLPDEFVPEESPLTRRPRGVMNEEFVQFARDGQISGHKATIEAFTADGLSLASGDHIDADVVVMATGYEHSYPFLADEITLKNEDGQFYLYRGIVPPETEGIGVLGRREVFNNFLSMNLSAHWLSDYFAGELVERPTVEAMHESIQERLAWMDREIPDHRGYFYDAYQIHSYDELLLDMGLQTRRHANPLSEWFGPLARGRSYSGLQAERHARE